MKKLFPLLIFIHLFEGCASYIQSIHSQIDQEERRNSGQPQTPPSTFGQNFKPYPGSGNFQTLDNRNQYQPPVNREYTNQGNHRSKANDLTDQDDSGSLWSGKRVDSFLFVNRNIKNEGDIIIVEVKKSLKDNISEELDRNFPAPKVVGKGKPEAEKEAEKEENPAPSAAKDGMEIVYDKISARVVEKLAKDYLLIRGQKEILHQNVKRYMQFQAVVQAKNINVNDTVSSDDLIENNIAFIRN